HCLTVGETPGVSVEEAVRYAGFDTKELNMVFQFELMGGITARTANGRISVLRCGM
ncbi:MAG: hypothetical protein IH607_06250, partial [Firmicutes bacterium]|nr:hypothetical protein [Bacillota bacterium]